MAMNIYTNEFIAGVIKGDLNANDVRRYCNNEPNLMALFKSLINAAYALAQSKVDSVGGMVWNLITRQFDFEKSSDLSLYTDPEFIRLQDAIGVVCEYLDKRENTLRKSKENIEYYIIADTMLERQQKIKAIKELAEGIGGKDAAVIIAAAECAGFMNRPPLKILRNVFGIVGSDEGFNKPYRNYKNNKDTTIQKELERIADILKKKLINE